MVNTVWGTLAKFGLKGRITAFVMDNASNNDTLVEAIADFSSYEDMPFSVEDAQMRCMPHTVHLAALKPLVH